MDDFGSVAISSLSEQQTIRDKRVHPNGIFKLFPQEEVQQSMPDRFEKMVRKYGERHAVRTNKHAFTYDELNRLANRVARATL
jgi:non-ribosomal peptide synthetase component F